MKRTRKPRRNSRQRRRDAYWQRVEAIRAEPFTLHALTVAFPELRRAMGVTRGVDPDDVDRPKRRSRASGART